MNIKQKLRKLLLEGRHSDTKYGCIMLYLDIPKKQWKALQDNIDKKDLYEPKDDTGFGLEEDPHITILYGLHNDIKDEDIEKEINKIKDINVKLESVSAFENDYDVIKFDVKSDDLTKWNKVFREFPHTNSYPNYHPHCTIAYCKKETAKKYNKILNDYLKDNKLDVKPSLIVYSKANGTKKKYKL